MVSEPTIPMETKPIEKQVIIPLKGSNVMLTVTSFKLELSGIKMNLV